MQELYNLELSEDTIKSMIELNPEIVNLTNQEIVEKILLLKKIECTLKQIVNIISSNSLYLSRFNDDVLKLFKYLTTKGFRCLNILFDSNPYILNLDSFEIDAYINNRVNQGELLEDIVDDLDSNTYLFQEI